MNSQSIVTQRKRMCLMCAFQLPSMLRWMTSTNRNSTTRSWPLSPLITRPWKKIKTVLNKLKRASLNIRKHLMEIWCHLLVMNSKILARTVTLWPAKRRSSLISSTTRIRIQWVQHRHKEWIRLRNLRLLTSKRELTPSTACQYVTSKVITYGSSSLLTWTEAEAFMFLEISTPCTNWYVNTARVRMKR